MQQIRMSHGLQTKKALPRWINAMLSLDRYGNVAFLPDTDTDSLRCTVNVNFEGYAMVLLYKD